MATNANAVLLTQAECEEISGGRYIKPGQRPTTVYYDDGVSILTSDPMTSNVIPNVT